MAPMTTDRAMELDEEHAAARRVLLDALEALGDQRASVIIAGAQAIYLQAGPGSLPIADFTTDGDLALDPDRLVDDPTLASLMEARGAQGSRVGGGAGRQRGDADRGTGSGRQEVHEGQGSRPGCAARRQDPQDRRPAKSAREDSLDDKDASDVLRLMQTCSPERVGATLEALLTHPIAGGPTAEALEAFQQLFGTRNGVGVEMAARALRLAMPEERVRAICLAYAASLSKAIAPEQPRRPEQDSNLWPTP